MAGRGNRAAIKELYFHPEFDYKNKNDIIVVLMLSGMERFDFVHSNLEQIKKNYYKLIIQNSILFKIKSILLYKKKITNFKCQINPLPNFQFVICFI